MDGDAWAFLGTLPLIDVISASNVPLVFWVSVRVLGATAVPVISAALARTLVSTSSMSMREYTKGALHLIGVPFADKSAYLSGTTNQSCWTELHSQKRQGATRQQ